MARHFAFAIIWGLVIASAAAAQCRCAACGRGDRLERFNFRQSFQATYRTGPDWRAFRGFDNMAPQGSFQLGAPDWNRRAPQVFVEVNGSPPWSPGPWSPGPWSAPSWSPPSCPNGLCPLR